MKIPPGWQAEDLLKSGGNDWLFCIVGGSDKSGWIISRADDGINCYQGRNLPCFHHGADSVAMKEWPKADCLIVADGHKAFRSLPMMQLKEFSGLSWWIIIHTSVEEVLKDTKTGTLNDESFSGTFFL